MTSSTSDASSCSKVQSVGWFRIVALVPYCSQNAKIN
ncbi:hypothetical protein kac68v162_gp010 [Nodularia phage vB_NspS-kac68v162]|uniref:Uncharacterized protein n=2 Tax=Ravarandavirus kac68v161 TaxID=2845690 RepID=A0A482MJU9_9CAUD|nr:hypothetical protein HWC13_gp010 [Nodularia phage vB_NspS-kac68v161]QBQ73660.1 hypothetical protein kac68v161_gp010 [Nodularia phage vB_NspS-kac68v161]QBQ73858.1 hypothetical protein kac68v162_gp010 [Nodularia phage vB_NspS-kac68v162]